MEADEQRQYLARVMQRTGWSQSELAAKAGLDPSTLSRFLSAQREGHALRTTTLRKIEAASGMGLPGSEPPPTAAGFGESEASPLLVPQQSPMAAVIAALTAAHGNIDPWVLNSRALEMAGYRPGDTLLVALGESPRPGDVVCAQNYDWGAARAETMFRLYEPPYLLAATTDPHLMRPLMAEDSKVQIKGVVVQTIRNRAG